MSRTAVPRRPSFRPVLERLEDRTAPSAAPLPPAVALISAADQRVAARGVALPPPLPYTGSPGNFTGVPSKFRLGPRNVLLTYTQNVGWYHNPVSIANYAMALYRAFYSGNRGVRPLLQAQARWLSTRMNSLRDVRGRAVHVYVYHWPHRDFGLPTGWRSGLGGAVGVAALYAASRALNDPALARQAAKLLPAFDLHVAAGGYRIPLGRNAAWYEECASPAAVTPRILNGHMRAVIALDWYARHARSPVAARLALQGVNGLSQAVALYHGTPRSLYDLKLRNQWPSYHQAHVKLLSYLYQRTGVRKFLLYAKAWADQS